MNGPVHVWDLLLGMLLGAAMMAFVWIAHTAPTTDVAGLEVVRVQFDGYVLTIERDGPLPEVGK